MKKCYIITINGLDNFGNRLQNYALYIFISALNINTINYWSEKKINPIKAFIKRFVPKINTKRYINFYYFNKKINTKYNIEYNNEYYYIYGSDQIWNPNFAATDFLLGLENNSVNKIAYAASIGLNELPDSEKNKFKKALNNFKSISVREDSGMKIVEELTKKIDIDVLIDPTMLLTSNEWDRVSRKPKCYKGEKYILNYFLGNLSDERKKAIEEIASKSNWKIINILDKNDPYYVSGPSEFLWLEKHAELICTDSFHSSVFAILYNRPFVVFDRDEEGMNNMGSRIDTLLSKFKLDDRKYNGKYITKKNLEHDYSEAYKILDNEREKSKKFLKNALDIRS